MTAKLPSPTTLTGRHVRLEPLSLAHVPDLFEALGGDDEVFRWLPWHTPRTIEDLTGLIDRYVTDPTGFGFAAIALATGRAVGVSGYHDFSADDERLEIGGTFFARSVWRSGVNTEAKLLMLGHAFEDLGMGRVMLKTDHLNERSQNAIRRLGAAYEGTLRRHRRRPDGSWRDSVHFSLLADEWPAAKSYLTARLEAHS